MGAIEAFLWDRTNAAPLIPILDLHGLMLLWSYTSTGPCLFISRAQHISSSLFIPFIAIFFFRASPIVSDSASVHDYFNNGSEVSTFLVLQTFSNTVSRERIKMNLNYLNGT